MSKFSTIQDALNQIDNEVANSNYRTAMKTCSAAITFFTPAPIECIEALKAKVKIIKAFSNSRLVDENRPSFR